MGVHRRRLPRGAASTRARRCWSPTTRACGSGSAALARPAVGRAATGSRSPAAARLLRDGRLVLVAAQRRARARGARRGAAGGQPRLNQRLYGAPLAVPLGLTTRVVGAGGPRPPRCAGWPTAAPRSSTPSRLDESAEPDAGTGRARATEPSTSPLRRTRARSSPAASAWSPRGCGRDAAPRPTGDVDDPVLPSPWWPARRPARCRHAGPGAVPRRCRALGRPRGRRRRADRRRRRATPPAAARRGRRAAPARAASTSSSRHEPRLVRRAGPADRHARRAGRAAGHRRLRRSSRPTTRSSGPSSPPPAPGSG